MLCLPIPGSQLPAAVLRLSPWCAVQELNLPAAGTSSSVYFDFGLLLTSRPRMIPDGFSPSALIRRFLIQSMTSDGIPAPCPALRLSACAGSHPAERIRMPAPNAAADRSRIACVPDPLSCTAAALQKILCHSFVFLPILNFPLSHSLGYSPAVHSSSDGCL